ncbi:MAG: hypothetical protein DRH24_15255 [Deltaproteobacteria bacterium]|nr:MAG: hypothetical protein DRH24_15255 [Deltaproteobacteria bacterium]
MKNIENKVKGIENVSNLVEIDSVWDEEYSLTPIVNLSERISGVSKLKTTKNELLAYLMQMHIINDNKFKNVCGCEAVKAGLYFKSSEIKVFNNIIAIDLNILLPPESYENQLPTKVFVPEHQFDSNLYVCDFKRVGKKLFGIACAVYDENDRLISLFDQRHHNDQAIFKYKINNHNYVNKRQLQAETTIVLGFKDPVKPARIKIYPEASTPNDVFDSFYLWYKNDDYFSSPESCNGEPQEDEVYHPSNELECGCEFESLALEYEFEDDIPF